MVQFKVSRLLGLQVDADGVAMVKASGMQLTFHEAELPNSIWDVKTKTVLLPWAEIEAWKVVYGMFNDEIHLHVKSADVFGDLPGVEGRNVQLEVSKHHRDELKEFEKRAQEYQSGRCVDNVDEMIDDIQDFLYDHDDFS